MKVLFKNQMVYTGKNDGLVYYWSKRMDKMIARTYVVPKESNANRKLGAISRNLKHLELSEAYIADLKVYVAVYNLKPRDKCFISWRNAFLTLMFNLAKANSEIDLVSITRAQIESEELPCICVKSAVEAGLLSHIEGYETLQNRM
jgi:hypothetical protein